MNIFTNSHLTYCTNIHPGESWTEVFENLKKYSISIKDKIIPNKPFGIGLRLSKKAAAELLKKNNLQEFKTWLMLNDLYVFTINAFPYGDFHNVKIKDKVHLPDWTTHERVSYTEMVLEILTFLLPNGIEGGISTSPLSYKLWFKENELINQVKTKACKNLIQLVTKMVSIKIKTGKILHIDIEPEPDGILENTLEFIDFFNNYLLKSGLDQLKKELNCSTQMAKEHILNHLQLCYDVCHFALMYERPKEVIYRIQKEGIKIGKIQISAALKCKMSQENSITEQQRALKNFDEPTYLHQSIVKFSEGSLKHFSDLAEGIVEINNENFEEIRTHFHVPVFISKFQILESTQSDIVEALSIWKNQIYSKHLEIETYTWGVLPSRLQTDVSNSIIREMDWVINQINTN